MKRVLCSMVLFLLLANVGQVHASYMLPYPSYMPGNTLYRLSRVLDRVKVHWSFGSIAQAKTYMSLSDKYLVEAKTLFEYQQYLLGADALMRSNIAYEQIPIYIQQGRNERKDMSGVMDMLIAQNMVHKGVLSQMAQDVPKEFLWTPEKTSATKLPLFESITGAMYIRQSIVDKLVPI